MSEPVQNVEIEDVLSSIRRLVSEDARPKPIISRPAPDRLVLTPSQRVTDQERSDAASVADPETAQPAQAKDVAQDLEAVETAEPSDHAEAVDTAPDLLTELVTESIEAPETQDAVAEAAAPEQDNAPEIVSNTQEQDSDTAEDRAKDADDALMYMVEQEVEQALKAFVATDVAQPEPDDDASDDADADTDSAEAQPEAQPEAEAEQSDDSPADTAEPEVPHQPRPAPTLEQKVAELEAMIAQTDGWDTESEEEGDNAVFLEDSGEPIAWQDYTGEDADQEEQLAAEKGVDPDVDAGIAYFRSRQAPPPDPVIEDVVQPDNDDEDPDDGPLEDLTREDTAIIDESVLRDMVADIVRQELQGALGERITRNVRKLVRREIHRALLSQQLD